MLLKDNKIQSPLLLVALQGFFFVKKQRRKAKQITRSRLKGMPQKDLINIPNYDVRHLIRKVCSAVLKNGAEIESVVK